MSSSPLHIPLEPAAESAVPLKILTLNAHKGFTFFNRRMVLHELREAVREVSADLVFLQEVVGSNAHFSTRYPQWPEGSQYEFLADTIWSAYAYGRNAVYPQGHHGNALLSKYPIRYHANHDVSVGGPERRGLLHCVLDLPGSRDGLHAICVHLGLLESHRRQQLDLLCELIDREIPAHAPLIDQHNLRKRALPEALRERMQRGVTAAVDHAAWHARDYV